MNNLSLVISILIASFLIVGCTHTDSVSLTKKIPKHTVEKSQDSDVNKEKDSVDDSEKNKETEGEPVIAITPYEKVMEVIDPFVIVEETLGDDDPNTQDILKEGVPVVVDQKAERVSGTDSGTYYHIKYSVNKTGWIPSETVGVPTSKQLDVALVKQLPELPNGCEVTSLTMLLQSADIKIDKLTLAEKMKKVPFKQNGYKGDPREGFVGNMYHGPPGYSVYHGPVAALAKTYLKDRVVDLTGKGWTKVEEQLIKEKPVWVIVNVQFRKLGDSYWQDWKTKNGTIKVTMQEHSVLVTGYDKEYVYFNDPLAGVKDRKAKKSDFKAAWIQMGRQAISYN